MQPTQHEGLRGNADAGQANVAAPVALMSLPMLWRAGHRRVRLDGDLPQVRRGPSAELTKIHNGWHSSHSLWCGPWPVRPVRASSMKGRPHTGLLLKDNRHSLLLPPVEQASACQGVGRSQQEPGTYSVTRMCSLRQLSLGKRHRKGCRKQLVAGAQGTTTCSAAGGRPSTSSLRPQPHSHCRPRTPPPRRRRRLRPQAPARAPART